MHLLYSHIYFFIFLFFLSYADHRDLHSFPTRRSSDLCGQADASTHIKSPPTDHRHQSASPTFTAGSHPREDRKSTRLNSSHVEISYAVFCLKKKNDPNS